MGGSKLGDVLQILGNLGLIVGLVLVGIQIYQNTEIAKMQMVHQDFIAAEARLQMMAGENPAQVWARALSDPTSLTQEEHVVLDNILKLHLGHLQKLVRLQELGFELIDPKQSTYINGMAYFLSSTYGESWWEENNNLIEPTVAQAISQALDRYPDNYLKLEIERLNAVIAERVSRSDRPQRTAG